MESIRVGRYTLTGDPVSMTRSKLGQGRGWDSLRQFKLIAGITLEAQHDNAPLFDGPLSLNIAFYLPIVYASKIRLNTKPHTQSPDLDNLIKYITSVGTGIIFKDERTVCCIVARKYFSTNPRTEIVISQIEEDTW